MDKIIETVAESKVVEEAIPEVVEKAVKFNAKDAGIIGASVFVLAWAGYGVYKFGKDVVSPRLGRKKNVIDLTEDEVSEVPSDEAEEE